MIVWKSSPDRRNRDGAPDEAGTDARTAAPGPLPGLPAGLRVALPVVAHHVPGRDLLRAGVLPLFLHPLVAFQAGRWVAVFRVARHNKTESSITSVWADRAADDERGGCAAESDCAG